QLIKLAQHDSAARSLARALELDPANADALNLAGCQARVRGDFLLARELYARAQAAAPEDLQIAAAQQILSGVPLRAETEDDMPVIVPFARLEKFLDPARRAEVMDFARQNLSVFRRSHVLIGTDHAYDTSVRSSRVAMEPKSIAPWFKPLVEEALPQVFARLGYAPFEVAKIELQMTAHLDGDFYTVHNDNSHGYRQGHDSDGRRISFVYYFCREPKRFTGGGLKLFDTDLRKGAYRKEVFSRISPDDNSIVFFPSAAMHEVEHLRLESDDPADGRFTLNGWVHPLA
ncbi:MAG: 2OG-Fe(II) oxygenase, partial [Rhodovibrionaceae bacterium]